MANFLSSLLGGFGLGSSSKIYGKKPKVPDLPSLEEAQGSAIGSNIKSLEEAIKLATGVNAFNQSQLDALREKTLPGASAQIQQNILSMLQGELPQGTLAGLQRTAAERGMAAGTVGGGFQLGRGLADQLGLSLQLTQQGLDSATQWLQGAAAPTFDVSSMFITPQQKYADQGQQFQRDFMASKIAAAPDPSARGQFDSTMALIGMVLSAYGGGGGYQGTYNTQQQQQGPLFGPQEASAGGANSFYIGGGGYGFGKQSGGSWFLGSKPGPG